MDNITLNYQESLEDNTQKTLTFSKSLLQKPYKEESLFVMKVEGQSMQPVILDNALVIADLSQKELVDESIYIVQYDNRMWIKKAKQDVDGSFIFVSINNDYSHLVYAAKDVYVIAKALLTFRNL